MTPRAIVVMGPSGCGKSTLGKAIADRLRWVFVEGDDLHPRSNIEKLRRGESLTDSDREPWLDAIARELRKHPKVVASCSALKRRYRDRLRAARDDILFVLPDVAFDELSARLSEREDHFMPPSQLDDQCETLERPDSDENTLILGGDLSVEAQVERVIRYVD